MQSATRLNGAYYPRVGSAAGAASESIGFRWPSLSRLPRFFRTIRHIQSAQLAARLRFMAVRHLYALAPVWPIGRARRQATDMRPRMHIPSMPDVLMVPEGIAALERRAALLSQGCFDFLGHSVDYSAGIRWRDPAVSSLWAFNLHYLGAVPDLVLSGRAALAQRLLSSWSTAFEDRWDPVAWHPYPVSLRLTNLCIAASAAGSFGELGPPAAALAATHAAFLLDHLEYDLRGNHLLENACALLFAARFFEGPVAVECERIARRLLTIEVPEQILADGAHFELSPMYHTIVMHRLLQAVALLGCQEALATRVLIPALARMAIFLRGILCPDGDIPPLGDSARGVGPQPRLLLDHARQLGFISTSSDPRLGITSFSASGLHVFRGRRLWAVLDAGPVCAPYLPGHGQADSLTVEVWSDGGCVVGDPGVHDYTGPERAWGRSSRAHSTLTVDDADTSEVYGSFRVGGRATVTHVATTADSVEATLRPFGVRAELTRRVRLTRAPRERCEIQDSVTGPATSVVRSRLHLHPDARVVAGLNGDGRRFVVRYPRGHVAIEAQHPTSLQAARASRHYGVVQPTQMLVQELRPGAGAERGTRVGAQFVIVPLD